MRSQNGSRRTFEVAFSGDFLDQRGDFAYPQFDLSLLQSSTEINLRFLSPGERILAPDLDGIDALIVDDPLVTRESLPKDGRLSVVARFGVGFDSVDVAALTEASVALVNTPDGVRRPVATSIVALILAVTMQLVVKDRLARRAAAGFAEKGKFIGTGLVGKMVGSVGLGNIGSEMFRLLKPFDVRMIAHDPQADRAHASSVGVDLVGFEELLERSDILAVNCPLNAQTEKLIGREALAKMKRGSILINTARGRIIDQAALTTALLEGHLAGAGLDVFEHEPPSADDPLLSFDNVVLSPHALCWTDECISGNGAADVRAVLDVMAGRAPASVVNRAVLADDIWLAKLAHYGAQFGQTSI